MKDSGDLTFIRPQVDLSKIIGGITEHFLDTVEFPSQNLRNAWEYKDIFHSDDREPHSLAANQTGAFRNVGHSQISINQVGAVITSERGFQFRMASNSLAEGRGDTVHSHVVVS